MTFVEDIICAPATLSGGALAVIRMSGSGSIELADKIFKKRDAESKPLVDEAGYTLHYGDIFDSEGAIIDDVILSLFRSPHSYTGEDGVEISCHGSGYIVQRIIELLIDKGARIANAGEFTTRAFMAGRIDLSQAEAVADMIAVSDRATHRLAQTQMRGGYSQRLETLREKLLHLCALMELELDFSEEDVEFANRDELQQTMSELTREIEQLRESFRLGNAIKNGVGVAIVGSPNAGKSTLLNRILGEDRAMVSSIAGTTRDSIEESVRLDGVTYRFIDTAGLHETDDELEQMGIERTISTIATSNIIIQLTDIDDISDYTPIEVDSEQRHIIVFNKIDKICGVERLTELRVHYPTAIFISAKNGVGIDNLLHEISNTIDKTSLYTSDITVSNTRHYEHLTTSAETLLAARESLRCNLPSDLIVDDLRHSLHEIGAITGAVTSDDILAHIFSSFCIGK